MNIRDEKAVRQVIENWVNQFGRIDCLVNNAGGQFGSPGRSRIHFKVLWCHFKATSYLKLKNS